MKNRCRLGTGQDRIKSAGIFFVPLYFNAGAIPPAPNMPVNQRIDLPGFFTRVCKLTSNNPSAGGNNIFLHFAPFYDAIGGGNLGRGRLMQLGNAPQVFPLQNIFRTANSDGGWITKIETGIPSPCYISTDFDGTTEFDVIAFFNDDVEISTFK